MSLSRLPDRKRPPTPNTGASVADGGEPPYDGSMENRLTALEARLDTIIPTLATKADIGEVRADLQKVSADISRWTLATMITIIGTMLAAIFGINQIYKAPVPIAAQQPQPIIIYAQPAAPPPSAAPNSK